MDRIALLGIMAAILDSREILERDQDGLPISQKLDLKKIRDDAINRAEYILTEIEERERIFIEGAEREAARVRAMRDKT